jgi:preprotein translocase subunit SecF
MKKNVGKLDQYVRYALGIIFVVLAVTWTWWMLIPAVISIATAALGTCGLYSLFGINTCKIKTDE